LKFVSVAKDILVRGLEDEPEVNIKVVVVVLCRQLDRNRGWMGLCEFNLEIFNPHQHFLILEAGTRDDTGRLHLWEA
jgi:hypothetical protein